MAKKHAHLTQSDRIIIQTGLENGSTRKAIADTLGKDKSTICKEVKLHSKTVKYSRSGFPSTYTHDCSKITECGYKGICKNICKSRVPIGCKRRDRKVGVCNGCPDLRTCKLDKRLYDADEAHEDYRYTLRDSREGVNLTTSQARELGEILKDGLSRGHSIAVIKENNPEIEQSEKTLYTYIETGVFSECGLINLDLPAKVKRRYSKQVKTKVRKDHTYLKGRTYKDFEAYIAEHPTAHVVEMDTVYNDGSSGPFIQTFQFVDFKFMIGIYHDRKTAEDMYNGVCILKERLGEDFPKFAGVILTDRGTEFTWAEEMESLGCKVFYCDPMASYQKSHVENNHLLFRRICPKGKNLRALGLTSQEAADRIFSHINSYPRESLHGKSPVDVFTFFYDGSEILDHLKIKKIDPDELLLKPGLLLAKE